MLVITGMDLKLERFFKNMLKDTRSKWVCFIL